MGRLILKFARFFIIIFPLSVVSAPVTFNCETSVGVKTDDLFVDFQNELIFWGDAISKYEIVGLTEEYITAYKMPTETSGKTMSLDEVVGGEVFVLNRVSGNYIRGSVNMVWVVGEKPGEAKLRGNVYRGKCIEQPY